MISRVALYKNLFDCALRRCMSNCLSDRHFILKKDISTKIRHGSSLQPKYLCDSKLFESLLSYQSVRFYAKSKDKPKSKKGGQTKKVHVNEETLAEVIDSAALKDQMERVVERLKDDFIKNLSLRSTSGSVESLPITFEGKDYILQDLAQVVRKNPKTVVVNMASFPQVIPTVLQALSRSGMNLSPQQDGTTLFIPIPKVTKEHREMLSKNAKALFIKCRDNIKDVQNKFIKAVKNKEKTGLSQDTSKLMNDYITSVGTEYITAAEKMLETKQQELLKES